MATKTNNYSTLSEAILSLRNRGFLIDFNSLAKDKPINRSVYSNDPFEIIGVYRFERNFNRVEEAVLYVLKSRTGLKGYLTNWYGMLSDAETEEILETISNKRGRAQLVHEQYRPVARNWQEKSTPEIKKIS